MYINNITIVRKLNLSIYMRDRYFNTIDDNKNMYYIYRPINVCIEICWLNDIKTITWPFVALHMFVFRTIRAERHMEI